ncbi:hypothetical protein BC835DRAFT_1311284 [Cytidiella melzeri]|nr:hypothetical protein BC835DRAFT_1311284 [Cytidiella melzeri]
MPVSSSVTEPAVNHPCHYHGPQEPARCPERAADLPGNSPCILCNSPNSPITVLSSSPTPEPQQDNKSELESYQDSEIDYNNLPRHTIAWPHKRIRLISLLFKLYEDPNNFLIQNTPGPALLPQPCKKCVPRVYAIDPHLDCNLSTHSYDCPYNPECETNIIVILLSHVAHLVVCACATHPSTFAVICQHRESKYIAGKIPVSDQVLVGVSLQGCKKHIHMPEDCVGALLNISIMTALKAITLTCIDQAIAGLSADEWRVLVDNSIIEHKGEPEGIVIDVDLKANAEDLGMHKTFVEAIQDMSWWNGHWQRVAQAKTWRSCVGCQQEAWGKVSDLVTQEYLTWHSAGSQGDDIAPEPQLDSDEAEPRPGNKPEPLTKNYLYTVNIFNIDTLARSLTRKPSYSIEAFTKVVCDYYNMPYRQHLWEIFADTIIIKLHIMHSIHTMIYKMLGWDEPDWRVKNAFYKVSMGGNNSLKRIATTAHRTAADTRTLGDSNYFVPVAFVDCYASKNWKSATEEDCKKMWGLFNELGVFAAACRHGLVLWVIDMVCSGKLAKYPLTIVLKTLELLEECPLVGYDVGCSFSVTTEKSSLGPAFTASGGCFCVCAFHSYSHSYTCQLEYHPNVITSAGIEDLETMERIFSVTNMLALVTSNFELQRLNIAQTSYRMRTDITKSLQMQCKAIWQAIAAYNTAAATLDPMCPSLNWLEIGNQHFLEQFALLQDTCRDICGKQWTELTPCWLYQHKRRGQLPQLSLSLTNNLDVAFLDGHAANDDQAADEEVNILEGNEEQDTLGHLVEFISALIFVLLNKCGVANFINSQHHISQSLKADNLSHQILKKAEHSVLMKGDTGKVGERRGTQY